MELESLYKINPKKACKIALKITRKISCKYARMNALNDILNGYGVECIRKNYYTQPIAEYINIGDIYATTIIQPIIYEDDYGYNTKFGRIKITSIGDYVEAKNV